MNNPTDLADSGDLERFLLPFQAPLIQNSNDEEKPPTTDSDLTDEVIDQLVSALLA